MSFDPFVILGLVVTGVLSAIVGLLFLTLLQRRSMAPVDPVFREVGTGADYLFDGENLLDATPSARNLLPLSCRRGAGAWPALLSFLETRFADVRAQLEQLTADGTLMVSSHESEGESPLLLRAEFRGGLTRISVVDADSAQSAQSLDPLTRRAIRDELAQLRAVSAKAPIPIWREASNGDVIWANARYIDLAVGRLGPDQDIAWPLPKLFKEAEAIRQVPRQALTDGKDNNIWFDVDICDDPSGRLFYALPANATVKAEEGLRAFMQTLTKTFAHLSTGLAIFDDARRLVLFNPALIDLTGLSPELLTSRPSLAAFFDALRENSMIPEPRNYKSWRNRITDIEEAAANGLYQETWSLPSGQTYQVAGRPHPNGALALSFEDISTEMSQTRRYRADLELGQAVIDAVDEAIAVFSTSGILVMTNTAYAALWGHDPAASLSENATFDALCEHWRGLTAPTTLWDRAEDFSITCTDRSVWQDDARLLDGRKIACRFSPLAGGAMMASFLCGTEEEDLAPITFSSARRTA